MQNNLVLVADFGGQYNQLIARRVRELKIYCEVVPWTKIYQEALANSQSATWSFKGQTVLTLSHN